ncbi:MAG: putative tricarboxylic transport rane protein [Variibacter sp.]|jgi:putative tricarboxylic transport membrane protein|nr:putative tricarboxylic transport rane protein [Variibacter sp.]
MRAADLIGGVFWLAIAAGITASGYELRLGVLNDPGSGFLVFWVGVIMLALSSAALLQAFRQPAGVGIASLWAGTRWWQVPYVVALLAAYVALLPYLGFPLTTVLLLVVLFKTIEPQGWAASIVGALVIAAITYLVFARWLGTQLPLGTIWGG